MPKFVPRERKHKVRERLCNDDQARLPLADSNATEITPHEITEKERKRQHMKEELRAQQPAMSSKKRKRLDKYVDKKLRKEENLDLIKKLASSKVDTSLMRSSRSLGVTKLPKREVLLQALNESKAGINLQKNHNILYERQDNESDVSDISENQSESKAVQPNVPMHSTESSFGSGLKRSLETGSVGNPVIKKRRSAHRPIVGTRSEPEWDGFGTESSLDSEQDDFSESHNSDLSDGLSSTSGTRYIDENAHEDRKQRSSAFKAWASTQFNEALGFTPSEVSSIPVIDAQRNSKQEIMKPREPDRDPLPPELQISSATTNRKAFIATIERPESIQTARLALPVVVEEQKIMEAVFNHPIAVICGATGSGKTTQLPQFLYEAGFGTAGSPNPGMIGVTQPRRVAAVSMAKRVAEEFGEMHQKVSYQIRFDSSVSGDTAIKFMTDGILLREIVSDVLLSKYSAIVIDEAHERTTNTDVLIAMVCRILELRNKKSKESSDIKPLKLIIMSATLRKGDFMENEQLFRTGIPPLLQIEGRQFDVNVHFARETKRTYVDEAFHKIRRGHKKLPPGGMLVFLTGHNEIIELSKRLREALPTTSPGPSDHKVAYDAGEVRLETDDFESKKPSFGPSSTRRCDEYEAMNGDEASDDELLDHEDGDDFDVEGINPDPPLQVHVLPLYSQLQIKDQLRVFEPPPANSRLIVLATNVAETSLTIPGIRYVFDSGRAKDKYYNKTTGVESYEVGWISKASAKQRTGRAGRTGTGHCYRLYSSAVYEADFEEHAEPEILRMPVEGVVLQLRSMGIANVINFPFPTPPNRESLMKAEKLLTYIGAISENKITATGQEISQYPVSPRFSKMLTMGHNKGCMPYAIALVAALAIPNLFIPETHLDLTDIPREDSLCLTEDRLAHEARSERRREYNLVHRSFSSYSPTSDALKGLKALCQYVDAGSKVTFCQKNFLSPKAMAEANSLRAQLASIVRENSPTMPLQTGPLPIPTKQQVIVLQRIIATAHPDNLAILSTSHPNPPVLSRKPTRAIDVPYLPIFPIHPKNKKPTSINSLAVFIHPVSLLARLSVKELPTYIVYSHLQRSAPLSGNEGGEGKKVRMHALAAVNGMDITTIARESGLLEYGKPVGKVEEKNGGRVCWVVPSLVPKMGGSTGWPLPAQRVLQSKNEKGEWVVDRIIR